MALTNVCEIMGGEVVSRNPAKGSVWLELDSGERALLPARRSLSSFDDLVEGAVRTVKVIHVQDGNIPGKPFILVSEYLDDEPDIAEVDSGDEADEGSSPYAVSPDTVVRFPVGKKVKGTVERVLSDSLVVSIDSGILAVLSFSELAGSKKTSFRRGGKLNAFVMRAAPEGIALTRRAEVAIAA